MRFMILSFAFLFSSGIFSQSDDISYEKALVNFEDYKNLMLEVESVRANRLISLDQFNSFAEKENTIILDTRSFEKYTEKHVKGAINLPFTEFTQDNLERLIPDKNPRILIYCKSWCRRIHRGSRCRCTSRREIKRMPCAQSVRICTSRF